MDDLPHAADAGEPPRESQCGAVVALHADRQGADAALEQPRRLRIDGAAVELHHLRDAPDERGASRDGPGDQVGVAAEVLGGGMDDGVDAVPGGADVDRGREGHVGGEDGAGVARGVARGADVEDAQGGVGGEFDEDDPCVGGKGRAPGAGVVRVHEGGGDAAPGQFVRQEGVGGAVEVGAGHDVVARFGAGEQGRRDGGHAAGQRQRVLGAFERGDRGRDGALVGVVAVTAVLKVDPVVGAGPVEGGAADDGIDHGAAGAHLALPCVDRVGRWSVFRIRTV